MGPWAKEDGLRLSSLSAGAPGKSPSPSVQDSLHQLADQRPRHFRGDPEGPPGKRTTFVEHRL